jgi:hypothetical protein
MSMACPNGGVVDFTRSPRRGAMTAVCAFRRKTGVDSRSRLRATQLAGFLPFAPSANGELNYCLGSDPQKLAAFARPLCSRISVRA